jgi:hypothetical protein
MGWFSGIAKVFKSIEKAVLGNNIIKWVDPAAYWGYYDVQRAAGRVSSLLTPRVEMPAGIGYANPSQATSEVTAVDAENKKRTLDAQKRQGVGVGATLLTGSGAATDDSLGKPGALGL